MTSAIDQLYAEVYANPDDDQLRRVLADALLAENDPRGELILFQLEPDKDHHRRAMRLIQAHGLSWLGPLRGCVIPLAYERGFVAACRVIADAVRCDEWATVHTIEVSEGTFAILDEMRSLHTVELDEPAQLERLAAQRHPRLDSLTVRVPWANNLMPILDRHLPKGLGKKLMLDRVPDDQQAELRSFSTPTELQLQIAPPLPASPYYDAIDE